MWAATVGAFLAPDLAVTEAEDYTCLTLLRDPDRKLGAHLRPDW